MSCIELELELEPDWPPEDRPLCDPPLDELLLCESPDWPPEDCELADCELEDCELDACDPPPDRLPRVERFVCPRPWPWAWPFCEPADCEVSASESPPVGMPLSCGTWAFLPPCMRAGWGWDFR